MEHLDKCFACDDTMYEEDCALCAVCGHTMHLSCLCEEGEDGRLCSECRVECPGCEMWIHRQYALSNHITLRNSGWCCPLLPLRSPDHPDSRAEVSRAHT